MNNINYNVVLTADTTDFVKSITDAKADIDKQLGTVDVKGLAEGNVAAESFFGDTQRALNYLDPTRFTQSRVDKLYEGLDTFYKQFAASMAKAADNFANSAGKINKLISTGEKIDNKEYNTMVAQAASVQNFKARLEAVEAMSKSKTEQSILKNVGGAGEMAIATDVRKSSIGKRRHSLSYASNIL